VTFNLMRASLIAVICALGVCAATFTVVAAPDSVSGAEPQTILLPLVVVTGHRSSGADTVAVASAQS
jgi:hypothetical protein